VAFNDEQLSYGELNERANRLAHYLREQGVGPEVIVGVSMERSIEMIVALLGILKAGGAYLPLDPNYPSERISYMLDDCGAAVLLTREEFQSRFVDHSISTIYLNSDSKNFDTYSRQNLPLTSNAQNLAYVMYTSGSTGRPKGVCVIHQAINRLVFNTNYIALESNDRVAHAANVSFDAATFEIWGALLSGATLVIIPDDLVRLADEFIATLQRQRISILFLPTPLFNYVVQEVPQGFSSIKNLLIGGDAVDPKWVRVALENGPPERLLHMYGPTESTTFASWHLINEVHRSTKTIPIGKPVANTEIYILDPYLQVVPIGVPGELYVGGDGLARGYLQLSALTAEKFIPHPFSRQPGQRLYRTGDLAQYRIDGSVEFLGRVDVQVKLRGYRIELGEIEAVLGEHKSVEQSVVVAREDNFGEKRLVAYVVAKEGREPTSNELRVYLAERLPEYMLPSGFVVLDQLPLTPNGKIDRRALPAPDQSMLLLRYVEPRTFLEKALAGIWAKVLKLDRVGIDDNFFELGGHSLLVTQIASEVRRALKLNIRLVELFRGPTIRQMAESISLSSADPASLEHRALLLLHSNEVSINSTLVFAGPAKLTPQYLDTNISPYLNAIDDLQRLIDEIKGQKSSRLYIKSISQSSPIGVDLNGAPEAIQLIRDTIVPWRRRHTEKIAHLEEKKKQAEIGSIKADILEKRARAARDNAEAEKTAAEAARQREETEKLRLDNEKLQLELIASKFQLALDLLSQISPSLPDTEKTAFVVKLLPVLDTLVFSELEIESVKITQ
jgi:amino acid adenylation domain-containing protein